MREIKFRAWNVVQKKMENVSHIGFEPDTRMPYYIDLGDKIWSGGRCHVFPYWVENDGSHSPVKIEAVLMQYTGLKDKNGVEIYEEDIIKVHWGNGYYETAEVVYQHDGYWVNGKRLKAFGDVEVIGNIHDNPELLEAV